MTNIVKCERCSKTLIAEEINNHYCHPNFKDVKTILVDWFVEPMEDEYGDIVSLWKGLDGIIYRIVQCKHNPPHQPIGNTDTTNPRGNRTSFSTLTS